jgi:NAD-dependent deacetylase
LLVRAGFAKLLAIMDAHARPLPRGDIAIAADRLLACRKLLVLAGAGASADAGIPTFRGEGGMWRTHRAEDLASPAGFTADPAAVWAWYRERRALAARVQPHAGQRALALIQKHFFAAEVLVATTNEDDLLDRAGVEQVLHLHGRLADTACAAGCGWSALDPDDRLSHRPCPACGAAVRPGSVWFNEPLPTSAVERLLGFQADGCVLVGSSCLVAPVSNVPAEMSLAGLPVIEVNPEPTPFSEFAAASLRGTAKDILPILVDHLTSPTVRDQRRRLT